MLANSLFVIVEQNWDLGKIQQAIIKLKVKENKLGELNNTENMILCGLLCNYHPEIIARQLPTGSYDNILKQTWEIHGYLQQIALAQLQNNPDETYGLFTLTSLLSVAGFEKNSNTPEIIHQNHDCDNSNLEVEQSFNSKVDTSLKSKKNSNVGITTVQRFSDRQSNLDLANKEDRFIKQSNNRAIVPINKQVFDIETDSFSSLNRWNTIGGMVTLGLISIAAILAATIKYNVIVKTEGTVRPQGEVKLVQATREGKIKNINVKENQTVNRGDIVASLDDSQLQNERNQLLDEVRQSERELAQLQERINTLEVQIAIEATKSDRIIDSTKAELQRTQTKYQQDFLTSQAQIKEAVAQSNIARQELAKAQTELQSFQASINAAEASLIAAKSKRDRYKKILSSGAISQEQFDEAQLAVQKEAENLRSQEASLLGQKQTIEGQRQQLEVAEAKLSQAQAAFTTSIDNMPVEIAKQAIEREKATKNSNITSYIREKKELVQQKIAIEKQISQKNQQIKQLEQDIEESILRATTDGKILGLNIRNQNQVVNPQDTITKIVPNTASLIIKTQAEPKDRQRINIGQSVNLKINACPYPDYGFLAGTVTSISADTITSLNSEPAYYTVDINPVAKTLVQNQKTCQLQLGMSADANIITKVETPLQFLLRKSRMITD